MWARIRYLMALLEIASAGGIWTAIALSVPFHIFPLTLFSDRWFDAVWWLFISMMVSGISAEKYTYYRREKKIAHLSREDIANLYWLCMWGNIILLIIIFLLAFLDVYNRVGIVRWIIFFWLSVNVLIFLHISVAEAVHHYNKLQELKSQEALQEGTESGLADSHQPT